MRFSPKVTLKIYCYGQIKAIFWMVLKISWEKIVLDRIVIACQISRDLLISFSKDISSGIIAAIKVTTWQFTVHIHSLRSIYIPHRPNRPVTWRWGSLITPLSLRSLIVASISEIFSGMWYYFGFVWL